MAPDNNGNAENATENGRKEGRKPDPVSFFHPALKGVRRRVFLQWSRMSEFGCNLYALANRPVLILCVFILLVLSLYWAVQFHSESRVPSLTVWVVDFDGKVAPYQTENTVVGPAVTDTAKQIISSTSERVGYTIKTAKSFDFDPQAVRQGVYNEEAYAAVIVNPNATSLLRGSLIHGNTSYDPTGAGQFVTITARDQNTYASYIQPALSQFQSAIQAMFGPRWVQIVSQKSWNISRVPQAVNPAIGFTNVDLRPFSPSAATPSVTIGLIYLIIIAFFTFPFLMPIHSQFIKGDHPPMRIPDWLIWRLVSNIIAYFFLSLFYSFVSLAFQIPFSNSPAPDTIPAANANAYGNASFVVFWMLNWVGMAALGLPCENMAMVLGFPWSSFFLIFWVITNVATGFYALELAPDFFDWGYAWPLHRSMFSSSLLCGSLTIPSCRGTSNHPIRNIFAHRPGFWHSLCLDWCIYNSVPHCFFYHAMEDDEGVVDMQAIYHTIDRHT